MTTTDIVTAATSFVHSYARATALSSSTTSPAHRTNIPLIAAALGAHYASNTTAYTLGHRQVFESVAAAVPLIASHLENLDRSGLGYSIRMEAHRIEPVSASSALCWITWSIQPREGCGLEGWQWEVVYGYRRAAQLGSEEAGPSKIGGEDEEDRWEKPEGWWEFVVSDNEISGILARVPNFMEI
ncbi:putative rho protein [Mycena venus]|uniref:Putative rho protein n=1 Tax=Mycena venus TaxID=2733690 RepID=A0A8H6YME5_9AGAR|nr:putative rho protein [Mycena venus]